MIFTVTGKIGGGKTYWAVNYMVEKYLVYKPDVFQYVPRTDLRIVTNIRDLYLPHTNLNVEINRLGISGVFNSNYVQGHFNTIFVIDEAQIIFHRKYYDKDVFAFFQTSRHYGVDIILITQDTDSMCKEVKILSEYEIEATSRSRRTKNVFVYKYKDGEEVSKRKIIKFDKKIAALYTSRFKEEKEQAPMVWKRYALIAAVFIIAVVIGFKGMLSMWKPKEARAEKSPRAILMSEKEVADLGLSPELESHELADPREVEGEEIANYYENEKSKRVLIVESGRVTGVVTTEEDTQEVSSNHCNLAHLACVGNIPNRLLDYCRSCYLGVDQEQARTRLAAEDKAVNVASKDLNKNPSPQKSVGEGLKVFDSLKGAE